MEQRYEENGALNIQYAQHFAYFFGDEWREYLRKQKTADENTRQPAGLLIKLEVHAPNNKPQRRSG